MCLPALLQQLAGTKRKDFRDKQWPGRNQHGTYERREILRQRSSEQYTPAALCHPSKGTEINSMKSR